MAKQKPCPEPEAKEKDELYKELRPLMESIALIQGSYVDEDKDQQSKALVEGA